MPLVIVTVLPRTEQAPLAVIAATVLALVVNVTAKVEPYTALAGAPVNVTVGDRLLAAVVWLAVTEL